MLTRRSLHVVLAAVILTIVVALPAANAAQRQSRTAREASSVAKPIAPQDARTQEELEKRVQLLEKQVAAFQANETRTQKVMTELQRTVATLQANGLPVQRQGSNYIVDVPAGLTLHAANITVQGDAAMALKAGVKMDVNATTVNVAAQSQMDLKGATILLNAGSSGKGAARIGDLTACKAIGACTIAGGSPTVLIGP